MPLPASAWLLTTVFALHACGAQPSPPPVAAAEAPTVVYLVRHAEPVYPPPADAPHDPPLNAAGRERAQQLSHVLRDAGISRVLSTDLRRTTQTAGPLAERLGLTIEFYDPGALGVFAEELQAAASGSFLVAGHSNTTPQLVSALGGEPGAPIDEKTEFDRLYVVTLRPGRPPVTQHLRYGRPPAP